MPVTSPPSWAPLPPPPPKPPPPPQPPMSSFAASIAAAAYCSAARAAWSACPGSVVARSTASSSARCASDSRVRAVVPTAPRCSEMNSRAWLIRLRASRRASSRARAARRCCSSAPRAAAMAWSMSVFALVSASTAAIGSFGSRPCRSTVSARVTAAASSGPPAVSVRAAATSPSMSTRMASARAVASAKVDSAALALWVSCCTCARACWASRTATTASPLSPAAIAAVAASERSVAYARTCCAWSTLSDTVARVRPVYARRTRSSAAPACCTDAGAAATSCASCAAASSTPSSSERSRSNASVCSSIEACACSQIAMIWFAQSARCCGVSGTSSSSCCWNVKAVRTARCAWATASAKGFAASAPNWAVANPTSCSAVRSSSSIVTSAPPAVRSRSASEASCAFVAAAVRRLLRVRMTRTVTTPATTTTARRIHSQVRSGGACVAARPFANATAAPDQSLRFSAGTRSSSTALSTSDSEMLVSLVCWTS